MLKINLSLFYNDEAFFEIVAEEKVFYTSSAIANLLNLDLIKYNNLLIEKVIRHENFIVDQYTRDVSFMLNNISKKTYIERFKNTFVKELTLISIGGVQ